MMTELKGFEEKKGASRAKGVQHGALPRIQQEPGSSERHRKPRNWALPSNLTVSSSVVAKAALSWAQD